MSNAIVPRSDLSHDLGTSTKRFKEAHVKKIYVDEIGGAVADDINNRATNQELQRVERERGGHVVRHADRDGLDVGVREKIVVVLVGEGHVVALRLRRKGLGVDVAEGDDVRVRDLCVGVRVYGTDRSDADDAEIDFPAHGLSGP